ncbi:toxin-antitoxin system YwqK family antitoxin [Pseudochryseolinea flava]|uniref:Tetratricopeptide repeat protein n=1 Tax=Pseudochryseolinea flava TaxID=2059302 RepID=A0A364XYP6_9BACT|nr:toxin-antitoxin system YwqK family antitoxin [Pseudochryseolinea flava]RAV99403.1 hypothetical protein DQQ10_19465 [Pseudochryseolinea flava]
MRILLLLAMAIFFTPFSHAQTTIPLIHSGEVIEKGKTLYDSGKFDEAVKLYQTIPARDTNYVKMLSELALTYIALKKPEKAIETCELALKQPTLEHYRNHLVRSNAIALDHAGQYEKSVEAFKKAQLEYPLDHSFIFNLGITYYNHKEYEKAMDCFFKTLAIKPFHGGSHLNLARMAISQGRKVHAMMAMGIYLSIYTNDNERLVLMDKFLSNQLTQDEGTIPGFDVNNCEKLDQVIRAKIATESDFKTKMPLRVPVVQQYELFLQQLSMIQDKGDDRWLNHYLKTYKGIVERKYEEPFLYTILISANNDDVKKWRKKNSKTIDAYINFASDALKESRKRLVVPQLGFDKPVQAWFYDDGSVEALGDESGDKRVGRWVYFYSNSEKSAEGSYNTNGEKIGIWNYYHDSGKLSSVVDMKSGERTYYFESGKKEKHYFLKNDLVDGAVEIYFPTGELKEKATYKNGKRHGKVEIFFPGGVIDETFNYVDGKLEGESLSYFQNGVLFSKIIYKNGERSGPYVQYSANGKLRATGGYLNDNDDGEWKYYFMNGKLDKVGTYKNSKRVGSWKFYNIDGSLKEEGNYDQEGKVQGDQTTYVNEKKHNVNTFKSDVLVGIAYFDQDGKTLGTFANDKGNFKAKSFYFSGALQGEGAFKNGKGEGLWKFYYQTGQLQREVNLSAGDKSGKETTYFKNGKIKSVANYVANDLDGYYQLFYQDGRVMEEGWFQHDKRQQQWRGYFRDGAPKWEGYYLNDDYRGDYVDYNVDGKPVRKLTYQEDKIVDINWFDEQQNNITKKSNDGDKQRYEAFYSNGKLKTRAILVGGAYSDKVEFTFDDGKLAFQYPLLGSNRHGLYKSQSVDGVLMATGPYLNGNQHGIWQYKGEMGERDSEGRYYNDSMDSTWLYYHFNGKVSSSGNFVDDDRHGITTYYGPDGNPLYQKNYQDGDLIAYRGLGTNNEFGEWKKYTGNDLITFYYPSGKKAFEEKYVNGMLQGPRKYYYPTGNTYQEYLFNEGEYDGPFVFYYENGKPRVKGAYKLDELDGVVTYFNEDGTLLKTITYKEGIKNGKTILYNKGVKAKEYNLWNGMSK